MNKRNVKLTRLFETARLSPSRTLPAGMPLRLQNRVLTTWRKSRLDDSSAGMTLVFRAGLACASVVMLATIAWSFGELAYDPDNDVAIANYQLRADVIP